MMRTHSAMRPVSPVCRRVRSRNSRIRSIASRGPCRNGGGTSAIPTGAGGGSPCWRTANRSGRAA
ncbi:hypothetical protein MZTS_07245 [Methylorubrum zatmanii]|nr:hypothetical protein [Methylorubrum zatmanii]